MILIVCLPTCPVGWGCRIHRLHLCRGVRPNPNECPGYTPKQSDGEVPVMPQLWGMQSTPSLPSISGPLWPREVAPDMGQIELNCVLMLNWIGWDGTILTFKLQTYVELNRLKWNCFCKLIWIVWNRTVLTFNCVKTKNTLILNWNVWNRTIHMYKNGFGIK